MIGSMCRKHPQYIGECPKCYEEERMEKYNFEQILKKEIDECRMFENKGAAGHMVNHPRYGIIAQKVFFSTPTKVWKQAIKNLKIILEAKYYVVIIERKE